ncbi:urease accessory protein UreD [Falsihalocynthiibacter sp. SS001]|uniref:urease accessory protein UreD n=1 Tax=Falsihalocynthiibacter sp. SS001 TaxID=3349698 RepID=UPI0036D215CA
MLDLTNKNIDESARSLGPKMQRMVGRGFADLQVRAGRVRLKGLHQSGSAKVFLPSVHAPMPEVVFLNTAGGVTGGDHISYELNVGANASATATTQTAERAYESSAGTGLIDVSLTVAEGARLDWLPQETILFQGSNVRRKTIVDLATDARFLMVETIVLGRAAMGETLTDACFADWREVRRNGAPVWIEPFGFDARVLGNPASSVTLAQSKAISTIGYFATGAEDAVTPIRRAIEGIEGVTIAASGWNGKAVVRLMAADAWPLHRALAKILSVIRTEPLPRVWQK